MYMIDIGLESNIYIILRGKCKFMGFLGGYFYLLDLKPAVTDTELSCIKCQNIISKVVQSVQDNLHCLARI